MLKLRQPLRGIFGMHWAAMPDEAPYPTELVAVFDRPPLQEHIFLVERVVIALVQVSGGRLDGRQLPQLEGAYAREQHPWVVGRMDRNTDFVIVIFPVKLLLIKDVEPGSAGGLDGALLDGPGNGLADYVTLLAVVRDAPERQRIERIDAFDDNVDRLQAAHPFNLPQAELDLGQARLFLLQPEPSFGLLEAKHAADLLGRQVFQQELGNLLQREAHGFERQDAVQAGKLVE